MNRIQFRNLQRRFRLATPAYRKLLRAALAELQVSGNTLTVIYCNPERIRYLNEVYRGIDAPTDVLSFPDSEPLEDGGVYLGEIFIAPAIAAENAAEYQVDWGEEMVELHLHGLLHLLGYDHETDQGEMERKQRELFEKLRPLVPKHPPGA